MTPNEMEAERKRLAMEVAAAQLRTNQKLEAAVERLEKQAAATWTGLLITAGLAVVNLIITFLK